MTEAQRTERNRQQKALYMALLTMLGALAVMPAPGQFFENPSLEGDPGIGIVPTGWRVVSDHSTPDTGPLACENYPAADGETFLVLVTRDTDHSFPGTSEDVSTLLLEPLQPASYYRLSVDLASRKDLGEFSWEKGFTPFTRPVALTIRGMGGSTGPEEWFATSDPVTHSSWSRYSFILFPTFPIHRLIFEVVNADGETGPGNLLLDHLVIEEIDEPPVEFGDLTVPNVFTPNGDGINDVFLIRGLAPESSLIVFDRRGMEVYRSENYHHDWDGTDASGKALLQDTYWYVIFPSDSDEISKGSVYIKRE